jgi:hypothetical protein
LNWQRLEPTLRIVLTRKQLSAYTAYVAFEDVFEQDVLAGFRFAGDFIAV